MKSPDWEALYRSEHAHAKKLAADFSAARVGVMDLQGQLAQHLSTLVGYLESVGAKDEQAAGLEAAKDLLAHAKAREPQWENAAKAIADLIYRASHVPGLSCRVDELEWLLKSVAPLARAAIEWEPDRPAMTGVLADAVCALPDGIPELLDSYDRDPDHGCQSELRRQRDEWKAEAERLQVSEATAWRKYREVKIDARAALAAHDAEAAERMLALHDQEEGSHG